MDEFDENSEKVYSSVRVYTAPDGIAALICAVLGYLFIKFALFNAFTLYPAVFNLLFWVLALVYAAKSGEKVKRASHKALFAAAFIFNSAAFISSNRFTNFTAVMFAAFLFAYMLHIALNSVPVDPADPAAPEKSAFSDSFPADFPNSVLTVPFSGFGEIFEIAGYNARKSKSSGKIGLIIGGLIVGLPVTVVCGILLMNADDNFNSLVNGVFNAGAREAFDFVIRFLFGIPVAAYLFGMLYSNVKKENSVSYETGKTTHIMPVYAICSAAAPVCVLYTVFFISHFAYLTSALFGTLHGDFSYADYARQGFFELCAVSVINLGIIIFLNLFDKRKDGGKSAKGVIFFTVFITSATLILIITALGKMLLYIGRYGLTQLRVYTSWFMLLLFIAFVLILAKVIFPKIKLFTALFGVFAVMLSTLCFGDADGFIAKYNIDAFQSGKLLELDVELFYDLSDSAVKYAIPLADDPAAGERIRKYLEYKRAQFFGFEFKYYNAESLNAKKLLEEYFREEAQA